MVDVLLFPVGVQLLFPIVLLAWLVLRRHPSRVAWTLAVTFVAASIALLAIAGLWLILPWYTPAILGALLLRAAALSFKRVRPRPMWPRGAGGWAGASVRGVSALIAIGGVMYAVSGWRSPADHLALDFPLRQGTYLVVNGGSIKLLNAHLMTLSGERFRPYRGQSYGVDLVRVDALGRRASRMQPRDPAAYTIFGDSVFAPCAGRIVAMTDGLPDQSVPDVDRTHMAGNHVLIACGTVHVLLGHLQRGSVVVRTADTVESGAFVGRVGNTGNTGEPHLHIHAQREGTVAMPLGGEPLPIQMNGWYPVRNRLRTERR